MMVEKKNMVTKQTLFVLFLSSWTSAFLFSGGACINVVLAFGHEAGSFNLLNLGLLPVAAGVALAVVADNKYRLIRERLED